MMMLLPARRTILRARRSFLAVDMTPVPAVAAMHEHVKQRAGQQQQEGQEAEEMRPVLGEEEKGGDQQEANRNEPRLRSPKPARPWLELGLRLMPGRVTGWMLCLRAHGVGSFHW
jgi:hypothetical protein